MEQAESLVRQALAHYPHYQEGRRLLKSIEATRTEGEVERLWSQFEASASPQERLKSLARLLELGQNNENRVRDLIEKEKTALKRQAMEERLIELRALVTREEWSSCFDILLWLSRQGDAQRLASALEISPHFSVVCGNRRLLKLPDDEAKESWLSLLGVKERVAAGKPQGCLDQLEKIKRYFHSYPYFREEYDRLVQSEHDAAKAEADELMKELFFQTSSLTKAMAVAARARRTIAKLTGDEAATYRTWLEMGLSRHVPENSEEENLEDYRRALMVGNAASAASLRDVIKDQEQIALIDRELAEYFAICVEPIAVTTSPNPPIDLATEPRCPLTRLGRSPRHVLYREDDETIIVVNMKKLSAARYWSPHFRDLHFLDSLPDRDHFLFGNSITANNAWRAKLSETEAYFCAEVLINENYAYEEGASFFGMMMSSSKDNDYYAFIEEGDNIRVVKQSLDVVSSTVRSFHVKGPVSGLSRASYLPDAILLGTENGTFMLNSNLDVPHGSSYMARSIPLRLFAMDIDKVKVYIADDVVKVLNPKLKIIKQYPNSTGGSCITVPGVLGLCTATDIALVSLADDKGCFYDLNTDMFSQVFPLGRMMWTDTPTMWHCFDYNKEASTVVIRDITHDLGRLLEWRLLCTADQDVDTILANIRQLEDPSFFNLPAKEPVDAADA